MLQIQDNRIFLSKDIPLLLQKCLMLTFLKKPFEVNFNGNSYHSNQKRFSLLISSFILIQYISKSIHNYRLFLIKLFKTAVYVLMPNFQPAFLFYLISFLFNYHLDLTFCMFKQTVHSPAEKQEVSCKFLSWNELHCPQMAVPLSLPSRLHQYS